MPFSRNVLIINKLKKEAAISIQTHSMKNNSNFLIPFIAILSALNIQSCTPKEELPAIPAVWEKAIGLGDQSLLNSKYVNQQLILMAHNGIYFNASLEGVSDFINYGLVLPRPNKYRSPISEKVLAFRNEHQVILLAPKNVGLYGKEITYAIRDLDPDFQYFFDLPFFVGDAIGIDGNGTVLIPYHSASNGHAKSSPDFLMIKTRLINDELEVLEIKLIKENYFPGMAGVSKLISFDNFFQLNIGPYTFNIGASEVPELKHELITKSFRYGNEIITFGAAQGTSIMSVYKSNLDGANTTLINSFEGVTLMQLEFTEINGKIIGYGKSQLVLVELTENEIQYKELDNTGLEGGWISSITEVGSDKVFVTLASIPGFDRQGGYYKPLQEFFKEK